MGVLSYTFLLFAHLFSTYAPRVSAVAIPVAYLLNEALYFSTLYLPTEAIMALRPAGNRIPPPAEGMPEQAGAVAAGIEARNRAYDLCRYGNARAGRCSGVSRTERRAIAGEHVVSGADAALSMWGACGGAS